MMVPKKLASMSVVCPLIVEEPLSDGNQPYLNSVAYGAYRVDLHYEARPDVARSGRAGFLITTARRCRDVELSMLSEAQPLLRRWSLRGTPISHVYERIDEVVDLIFSGPRTGR